MKAMRFAVFAISLVIVLNFHLSIYASSIQKNAVTPISSKEFIAEMAEDGYHLEHVITFDEVFVIEDDDAKIRPFYFDFNFNFIAIRYTAEIFIKTGSSYAYVVKPSLFNFGTSPVDTVTAWASLKSGNQSITDLNPRTTYEARNGFKFNTVSLSVGANTCDVTIRSTYEERGKYYSSTGVSRINGKTGDVTKISTVTN